MVRHLIAGFVTAVLAVAAARADPPGRFVSINLCTDELLLDLAGPGQIAGLSPLAAEAARRAGISLPAGARVLSGTAEEIMVIRPDAVLSSRFMRRQTREFIAARGIRLEEFDVIRTVADVRAQIVRAAALLGNEAKGAARTAELDAALERLRAARAGRPLRVLPLSRRGWSAGQATILGDLLAHAGLSHAGGEAGIGRFVSLEAALGSGADAILLSSDTPAAEDQGQALLAHPALARAFPRGRRILVPEALTVCGGPRLPEAIDMLAREIARLPG
jgi:iron complex transport system substrate-binding protein